QRALRWGYKASGAVRDRFPKPRRQALVASTAGLVLALAVAGLAVPSLGDGAPTPRRCAKRFPPMIHDGFPEPAMKFSRNGALNLTLHASVSRVAIAGGRFSTMNYDGSFPAPTLVICPGDNL